MSPNVWFYCGLFAAALPFLVIAAIFLHYCVRGAAWKRKRRRGEKNTGFCPSSLALGGAMLFLQLIIRPSLIRVIEQRQQEEADEDDQGDPESPLHHLKRQLRDIRRREFAGDLVLRL